MKSIFILGSNEVQLFLDVIGVELENGVIVLDDFLMELEGCNVNNIDIGLGSPEDTCDLIIFSLL